MQARTISLPAFRGVTRSIVLSYLFSYLALGLLRAFAATTELRLISWLALTPLGIRHGFVWQLFTYSYVLDWTGVLAVAFGLLMIWFTLSTLEETYGRRWVTEFFYVTVLGGGLSVTLLAYAHVPRLATETAFFGFSGLLFGILVAFAALMPDVEFLLFFVLNIRAKYLVLIYVLIDTGILLSNGDVPRIALDWCSGVVAYLFVKYAPRRGLLFGVRESMFSMRNEYYRRKRRRAAKKFEVYMRKQNREVHFDADGRYVSPEDESRPPNDRKWMN